MDIDELHNRRKKCPIEDFWERGDENSSGSITGKFLGPAEQSTCQGKPSTKHIRATDCVRL